MSRSCTDEQRLTTWCVAIAGESLEERRSELFWLYLNAQIEPGVAAGIREHLQSCQDCREAVERERLLLASKGSGKVVFAKCPSSEELLQYMERDEAMSPWRRLEIKLHVDQCVLCREETEWAAQRVLVGAPAAEPKSGWAAWFTWKWAWAAAAAVIVAVLVLPSQFGSRRFARYAQLPDIPYEMMLGEFAAAHPDDLPRFRSATHLISLGQLGEGEQILRELENRHAADPSIVFFKGYVAVREGRWKEATLLCTKAESRSLDGFRCWYLANVALMAGDLNLARKEIQHAKGHTPYRGVAAQLDKMVN